jgi:NAD(P)-dependent dehydrogenase (short-subunit alcohol dehydrogenase family)
MPKSCKKDCDRLRQPPTNTLIPLDGENCIACKDHKDLCKTHNLNKYLKALTHKSLCTKFISPPLTGYKGFVNPDALFYTVNPPLLVPPGQKGYNMVPDKTTYPDAPYYPPITNPLSIAGKNVCIIGGAKNIGKAIATTLQGLGANVVATSRFPECYQETFPYPLLKLDVRLSSDVKHFFHVLMKKHFTNGKIDVLINLPGIHTRGFLAESNGDDLLDSLDLNVCGYQRTVYHALPYMRFSNDTRVISFGSIAGELPVGLSDGYAIGKRANQMWNDNHMIEALQRKALGLSNAEPTFTLIEPGFIQSTIGLYENYTWKDTDDFSDLNHGSIMTYQALQSATTVFYPAVSCPQDPPAPPFIPPFSTCPCTSVPSSSPLCANVPQLVADAIIQILRAPQPSARYLIDPSPGALNLAPAVSAVNILSVDDGINNVLQPFARDIFFAVPNAYLSQAVLQDSFCNSNFTRLQ